MYGFTPTISDDHLFIVSYVGANMKLNVSAYKLPVANIIASIDKQSNSDTSTEWTELSEMMVAEHWCITLIPSSSPSVIVGGEGKTGKTGKTISDIKMYDNSNKSWKKIGSLPYAKSDVPVQQSTIMLSLSLEDALKDGMQLILHHPV